MNNYLLFDFRHFGCSHTEKLWTNSTLMKEPVASLKADTSGSIEFGASDPKETYGNLVPELVYANTADFRPYYVYRKVKVAYRT